MSACFGCEIQTVYSCLNQAEKLTDIKNWNRTEPNRKNIWTVAALMYCQTFSNSVTTVTQ